MANLLSASQATLQAAQFGTDVTSEFLKARRLGTVGVAVMLGIVGLVSFRWEQNSEQQYSIPEQDLYDALRAGGLNVVEHLPVTPEQPQSVTEAMWMRVTMVIGQIVGAFVGAKNPNSPGGKVIVSMEKIELITRIAVAWAKEISVGNTVMRSHVLEVFESAGWQVTRKLATSPIKPSSKSTKSAKAEPKGD